MLKFAREKHDIELLRGTRCRVWYITETGKEDVSVPMPVVPDQSSQRTSHLLSKPRFSMHVFISEKSLEKAALQPIFW